MKRLSLCLAALALGGGPAASAPRTYDLPEPTARLRPPGDPAQQAGFQAAQGCTACHSVDYIAMQPPGKGRAFWDSEVTKMAKVYHAPIDETDGKAIAAYLADAY